MNELQTKISQVGCVPVIKLTNPLRDAADHGRISHRWDS